MKAILFTTISALLAGHPCQAAVLLQSPSLGVGQESVYWEYYSGSGDNRGLSNGNATGTPASGTGTIAPVTPGYRAFAPDRTPYVAGAACLSGIVPVCG